MGAMKLFDDDDDGTEDISNIEVNQEFARRYEHNKKREDLQRYEELKKKGRIDGDGTESESELSDEDDDEDDAGVASKEDIKFFDKLLKVKNRDPSLYQNVPFFSDSEEEEEGEGGEGEKQNKDKKKKTMYLKDVVAKNLIEEGPEFDDAETSEGKRGKTYNEEQEELRKEFLDAVKDAEGDDDDDEGELLKVKDGNRVDGEDGDDDKEFESKLGEYFGKEKELDEGKMFLMEFFKNKMWKDKKKRFEQENMDEELSDDEEAIDRQEEYEARYNFRHEENVGDRVMGHARVVEGTVRKKENPRKEQRKKKEERMRIAEMERKEELKHLKNLKKKEMEEKIQKVMKVAGIESSDCPLDLDELEDDFDPQEYDKMMKKAFDDKYYEAEDADPEFGSDDDDEDDNGDIQKPDFDKEDELLGLPKGWDAVDDVDDFLSARERILKQKPELVSDGDKPEEEQEDGNQEEEGSKEEGKRKRKRKLSLVQNTKQELLDEYYKLDYEGTIGDLKTRFKYAKVDPNKFGLKTADILLLDDKDLNQFVSVKKLAPYRETEWKVPGSLKYQYKMKAKELKSRFKSRRDGRKKEQPKDKTSEINNEESTSSGLSRKARRKLNQAPLKLSQSRLSAYGKTTTQDGGKKRKH